MTGNSLVPAPLARLPWKLLLLVLGITGFGLIVLYSAAGGHLKPWAFSQGLRFCMFFVMALVLARVPERAWKAAAFPLYIGVLILLILVEMLGFVGGGSQRWLDLGFIRIQPSEMMKLAIVLALARYYDLLPVGQIRSWSAMWPPALAIGVPLVLVMIQPDLGTSLMIAAGGLTVMFLAGLPLWIFIGGGLALAAAVPIAFSMLHEYQQNRVLIFLDPESDPLGAGYHISQSKIAIGSGGIFGKGFLNGSQSHLDYLPEGHTDFVFATMAEEWGLMGGLFIIVAFIMLVRWGLRVGQRAQSRFARLTAAALATTIFFYVAINLMMVMGLAPVVGIPLPLFSFGGSAMMTVMICIGIMMSIERSSQRRSNFD
ncbi:rod shape-determining protein RodA [Sphingomonas cavernae]|uniref:Peptidoglycan glycosyltransferase MrdB n=1 Tax=Sphingomonas cavernae TaxID=2320861 RepID=A0A418WNR7_9SPHN|nr:rod shape-determining protein RodA [Sphingomonas cavernae]RJF92877.1 rod shape-determining protein RodA [Sphingomonas cavernae]